MSKTNQWTFYCGSPEEKCNSFYFADATDVRESSFHFETNNESAAAKPFEARNEG